MTEQKLSLGILMVVVLSCSTKETIQETYPDIVVAGAMRNVIWKGELQGVINLDTIQARKNLYGLGPVSYLTGELLINNGEPFISKVLTDSSMTVETTFSSEAPFFVYGIVNEWQEFKLPNHVTNIKGLENYIDEKTKEYKRPFAFKLAGQVVQADIHIQNLPKGTKVNSPDDAHLGQVNYTLENEQVEIVGFFSTKHKGIFTHHDSFLHMHLITADRKKMGHLEKVEFSKGEVKLYLPVK